MNGPGSDDPRDSEVNNRIMASIYEAEKSGQPLKQIVITSAEHDALKRLACHWADITEVKGVPVVVRG